MPHHGQLLPGVRCATAPHHTEWVVDGDVRMPLRYRAEIVIIAGIGLVMCAVGATLAAASMLYGAG